MPRQRTHTNTAPASERPTPQQFLAAFPPAIQAQADQLRALVKRAVPNVDEAVYVGCGTGALAIVACQHVGATGRVCGVDPGPKQVARARSKAERAGLPIDFQVGVIEQLAFPDHSFD